MATEPQTPTIRFRPEALAAVALFCVYLATMSGHLMSMDGLFMLRQSYALLFDHSIRFGDPVWTWTRDPTWNSLYGIGLSLLYLPGLFTFAPLHAQVPVSATLPPNVYGFYLRQLYEDPLYMAGASWLHPLLAATTAYLVARIVLALGFGSRASLWALAFYGIGSSTLVYARGDFAQLPEAMCWAGALLAALRYRDGAGTRALATCAALVALAILTRPVEGLLLAPAAAWMVKRRDDDSAAIGERTADVRAIDVQWIRDVAAVGVAVALAAAATLAVNVARFRSPFDFGYPAGNTWEFPGVERWGAVLLSPGRGLLVEFPAALLAPAGALLLARSSRRREVAVLVGLSLALLVNVAAWAAWWGGWCWGLRLFTPALPLVSVLAGIGTRRLRGAASRVVPALLLIAGTIWALPGVVTDLVAGYGALTEKAGFVWLPESWPPWGAWKFLLRTFPLGPTDSGAVDILWVRLAAQDSSWLLAPAVLLVLAVALAAIAIRRSADSATR